MHVWFNAELEGTLRTSRSWSVSRCRIMITKRSFALKMSSYKLEKTKKVKYKCHHRRLISQVNYVRGHRFLDTGPRGYATPSFIQNGDHRLLFGADVMSLSLVEEVFKCNFLANKCTFCCQTNVNIARKSQRTNF